MTILKLKKNLKIFNFINKKLPDPWLCDETYQHIIKCVQECLQEMCIEMSSCYEHERLIEFKQRNTWPKNRHTSTRMGFATFKGLLYVEIIIHNNSITGMHNIKFESSFWDIKGCSTFWDLKKMTCEKRCERMKRKIEKYVRSSLRIYYSHLNDCSLVNVLK